MPRYPRCVDHMVRNVETGRFERSLSALTAAGALVTAAENYFEHDSASFGNKMMWVPVVLGPVGAVAGVAGFCSRRMAKTGCRLGRSRSSPMACRARTCTRRASPRSQEAVEYRYNMEMGPPLPYTGTFSWTKPVMAHGSP